jgi:hypothetical protein
MAEIGFIFTIFNQRAVKNCVATDARGSMSASPRNSMQNKVSTKTKLRMWVIHYLSN